MATFGDLPIYSIFEFDNENDAPLRGVPRWLKSSNYLVSPVTERRDPPYFICQASTPVVLISAPATQMPLLP